MVATVTVTVWLPEVCARAGSTHRMLQSSTNRIKERANDENVIPGCTVGTPVTFKVVQYIVFITEFQYKIGTA